MEIHHKNHNDILQTKADGGGGISISLHEKQWQGVSLELWSRTNVASPDWLTNLNCDWLKFVNN